jgi:D-alanine-D-alanine ligase
MKEDLKILICYNAPAAIFSVYNGKPVDNGSSLNDLSESGFSNQLNKIKTSLQYYFTEVTELSVDRDISKTIKNIYKYRPDIIFNFVESVEGISSFEYCNAGLYELLGIHYTGNIPSCLGNCLNKEQTKNILRSQNIRTPDSVIIKKSEAFSESKFHLQFPVILKLLNEDASIGISEYSVVQNKTKLLKHLKFLKDTYKQDIIIEEYIEGRELNVAVLGNKVLPISEIVFNGLPDGLPKIVTYDGKWMEDSVYYNHTVPKCPAELGNKIKKEIEDTALSAYEALNCRDYARIDIRLSEKGIPFVIEVNPNPDISTDSGFARAAAAAGISHRELLYTIASFANARKKNDSQNKAS